MTAIIVVPVDFQSQQDFAPRFPNQAPNTDLFYGLDVHNLVNYTDSIASVSASPVPGDLVVSYTGVSAPTYPSNLIALFSISGGTQNQDYEITFNITFTSGATASINVWQSILPVGDFVNPTTQIILNTVGEGPITANGGGPITSTNTLTIGFDPSGVTSGTYSNVTVDIYGRVTFARALDANDITTALGYTPSNVNTPSTGNSENTASTVVARDPNGNFSAGTITADLVGLATLAGKLAQPQSISLYGDVAGSVAADFSNPVAIETTLQGTAVTNALGYAPLGNLSVGTVTVLTSGQPATVEVSTSGTTATLSFGIPAGQIGPTGPQATIGTPSGVWNASTNSPTLGNGGAGGTAGTTYIVSIAGSTSVDGNASWNAGDIITNTGSVWTRIPNAGGSGVLTTLNLPNVEVQDDGSGNGGFIFADVNGGVAVQIDQNGLTAQTLNAKATNTQTLTVNSVIANSGTFTTLVAPSSPPNVADPSGNTILSTGVYAINLPGGSIETSSSTVFEVANANGQSFLAFNGQNNYLAGNLYVGGNVISVQGTLGTSTSATFASQDISNYDQIALASSASVKTRANTTGMRGTSQYNINLTIGQSRTVGTEGAPPLSTSSLDVLMLGENTYGVPKANTDSTLTTYTTVGNSYFNPIEAAETMGGTYTLAPGRTGFLTGIQNVSVTAGSNNGTISWTSSGNTGINAASVFEAGDNFQMSGFTNAVALNAATSNANTYTVQGTPTATQIVVNAVPPAVTTAPESNITIAQADYQPYGQTPDVTANIEFRKQQLNQRCLLNDSSRLNVAITAGYAVVIPAQSPTGNPITPNITPSPYMYNKITSALTQVQAAATAGGNGYPAGTSSLQSIYCLGGGDESGQQYSKANFRGEYAYWLNSVISSANSIFGAAQTAPPFVYTSIVSGGQLNNGGAPPNWSANHSENQYQYCVNGGNIYQVAVAGTTGSGGGPSGTGNNIVDGSVYWNYVSAAPASYDVIPVTTAQLELFGACPSTGFAWNYSGKNPNWYCIGPEYAGPDRGDHGSANGYAYTGCLIAKVRTKVELYGQGWLPCHILAGYVRANQILVSIHTPEPPIQIQMPYSFDQPQSWSDLGFSAYDVNGALTVTSAVLAGESSVLLTFNRNINASSCWLMYGDALAHDGMGMICDSDPFVPAISTYNYVEGSGALLSDNFTNNGFMQNGQPYPLWNWLCPVAIPCIAG